jgi:hypothetical protein
MAVAEAYGVPVVYGDAASVIAQATGQSRQAVSGVQGFYCSDPEHIMINSEIGEEAQTFVLWHEIGHLTLGHHLEGAMPSTDIGDLENPLHGVRSFEYMADAFAITMMQRTGVKENSFGRMSSIMTMVRFERHFEEAANIDFDSNKSYNNLVEAMGQLDMKAAVERKQEFLKANWPLLVDKADEVREILTGSKAAERKAWPAVIPLGQQSTDAQRYEVGQQRYRKNHAQEIEEAMGFDPDRIARETAAAEQRSQEAGAKYRHENAKVIEAALGTKPGVGEELTEEQRAAKTKAIEETAARLGEKMQGAFGRVQEPGLGWGSKETAEEIEDWIEELGP